MAIDQLALYNGALRALGERKLSSLTEDRPPRYLLDDVWAQGGGCVNAVLELGTWIHALRAVRIDYDTSITPSFGFTYAFSKPSDFVRLSGLSASETFAETLTLYEPEGGSYIYANVTPVYMRYVSNDASYGADLSKWPDVFSRFVMLWLACEIGASVTGITDMKVLEQRRERALLFARNHAAMEMPARFFPAGSWVRARGGKTMAGDRGKRSQLIG